MRVKINTIKPFKNKFSWEEMRKEPGVYAQDTTNSSFVNYRFIVLEDKTVLFVDISDNTIVQSDNIGWNSYIFIKCNSITVEFKND